MSSSFSTLPLLHAAECRQVCEVPEPESYIEKGQGVREQGIDAITPCDRAFGVSLLHRHGQ